MNRRKFLIGTAAGVAGLGISGRAQGQQPPAAGQGAAPGRGAAQPAGRGRGGPAPVAPEKLARISLMTLNFNSIMKLPWATNPTESQTLSILELPQYYVDNYGVKNMEFQHQNLTGGTGNDPDMAFCKQMRDAMDKAGVKAQQINIEIGVIANMTPEARTTWMACAKKWCEAAKVLGLTRLMLNQTGLVESNKAGVISVWKEIQDYAKPMGIKISAETRGGGTVAGDGRPPNQAPNAPPRAGGAGRGTVTPINMTGYQQAVLLEECAEASGGYTNLDFGGNTRFLNQQELNNAIKMMLKSNSGQMHIKSCENWDIGVAVKFAESNGYRGLYTIEVNPDSAIRVVYNTILAGLG
jgi:hypothetical protein